MKLLVFVKKGAGVSDELVEAVKGSKSDMDVSVLCSVKDRKEFKKHGVTGVPTMVLVSGEKNVKEIRRFVGYGCISKLPEFLK